MRTLDATSDNPQQLWDFDKRHLGYVCPPPPTALPLPPSCIRPPVAAWSAEQANNPDRLAWIAEYEKKSAGFAACAYLRRFGDPSRVHAKAGHVRDLHDRLSHALDRLPLA